MWSPGDRAVPVAFVGRGDERPRDQVLAASTGAARRVAWLHQVHGTACIEAREGLSGEADALTTRRRDLALVISTADCVPLVLLGSARVTAVHAGWRGLVGGVVYRALDSFSREPDLPRAWIGPAIGACCYEVGTEVAERVAASSSDPAVLHRVAAGRRPHVDLRRAVASQLRDSGVQAIETTDCCTRCEHSLHSYRRDGASAGRNLAFAWLPAS